MTFDEYQRGVMRTAKVTPENMLLNGVLGASGEAGKLADLLKKELFQGHPHDRDHYIKELGDVLYYLGMITESLKTTLEERRLHWSITGSCGRDIRTDSR